MSSLDQKPKYQKEKKIIYAPKNNMSRNSNAFGNGILTTVPFVFNSIAQKAT